ncbi:MAG: DUF309 domain-containing protein [Leptolyngbya sp. SIO3F4]|nr:DUF309 domain-containing protein [Leptolyngbya sp. SIO3F4]
MSNVNNALDASNQPAEFWVGIEQFNRGEYYACHNTMEVIWMNAQIINKGLYQGILQIAVGLYHLTNFNWQGAAILLGEGINRLNAYEDNYGGIDIAQLTQQAIDWLTALQETGPDHVQKLAAILVVTPLEPENQTIAYRYQLEPPQIQGI